MALTACGGGLSDADRTATAIVPTVTAIAQFQAAATAEAQADAAATAQAAAVATAQAQAAATAEASATAEAQAQATATAAAEASARGTATAQARPLRSAEPGAFDLSRFAGEIYDSIPGPVIDRLDAAGITRDDFLAAIGAFIGGDEPDLGGLIEILEVIGDLEVTFMPQELLAGMLFLPIGLLQAGGIDIDEQTLAEIAAGTRTATGTELAQFFRVFAELVTVAEEEQDIPEPDLEELKGFFATLPPDVKAELEADGWTQARIEEFIERLDDDESAEEPPIEELQSLFGPLADIPIPPFAAFMTASLSQFPTFVLAPLVEELGQEAVDELRSGARPPTGGEFLAFFETLTDLFANLEGVVIVCPDGVDRAGVGRSWDVGFGQATPPSDDVSFMEAILRLVAGGVPVDRARVYAYGISNGGTMVHKLARDSDTYAAIASVAGSPPAGQSVGPGTGRVSVLQVHGELDTIVPYDGGPGLFGITFQSASETVAQWAAHSGCDGTPVADTSLPGITIDRYGGCDGDREVLLYTVHDTGHDVPLDVVDTPGGLLGEAWAFFKRNPRQDE